MTVQRWALVPADPALPVRVFDDEEAARRAKQKRVKRIKCGG